MQKSKKEALLVLTPRVVVRIPYDWKEREWERQRKEEREREIERERESYYITFERTLWHADLAESSSIKFIIYSCEYGSSIL